MMSGKTPNITDYYADLQAPSVADMELQLQQLVQQGVLSPEDAQVALAQQSEMGNITLDPALKQAQMEALAGLQDISGSGGMTAMDQANLSKIKSQEDTANRGKREAILQNAQSRGMGGSGMELMAQLQNQQDSASRTSQRDMDVAAQAQQRALEALMQGGTMAGNMQNQDFNRQAQIASANDAISKFNTQNQQQVNLTNTGARNLAQEKNLASKQSVHNSNVGTANQQQIANKNLKQVNFDNELKKRGGMTGVATNNAINEGRDSQASADANNELIGAGISAMAMMSDERCKEDIEKFDAADFLDSLTGYKYNYKDKKHGEGPHVGVMAQDLLKTDAGSKLVSETPEGMVVDYAKAGPQMMASLADINERLKKIEKSE